MDNIIEASSAQEIEFSSTSALKDVQKEISHLTHAVLNVIGKASGILGGREGGGGREE